MTILQIGALVALAVLIGRFPSGRRLAILGVSALVVFWLQPDEPEPSLRFWLPLGTLAIVVTTWALTSSDETLGWRQNWLAVAILVAVVILVIANRYLEFAPSAALGMPGYKSALVGLAAVTAVVFLAHAWQTTNRLLLTAALIGIVLIFILFKTPSITAATVAWLLRAPPQADNTFAGTPLTWLGFSYIAFRLLHTIRDRQSGRLPAVTLAEYVDYVIFFPAFTAGPIDRVERFVANLRSPLVMQDSDWIEAGSRLVVGLFKKFVIADLLAVISINDLLVSQVKTAGWLWVFLYAYAFRIYFDFSGYTDVAIGMGRLLGVRLPENFAAPYLKSNIAQFWNSWHMSLTQWFRAYIFNPLTRAMRSAQHPLPIWVIILTAQITTMVLIGLWHGVTIGFAVWGLWHGIGLFIQNRWSAFTQNRMPAWSQAGSGRHVVKALGVVLTFNYVALGWLFFNLSSPAIGWQAIQKLFGLA